MYRCPACCGILYFLLFKSFVLRKEMLNQGVFFGNCLLVLHAILLNLPLVIAKILLVLQAILLNLPLIIAQVLIILLPVTAPFAHKIVRAHDIL